MKRILFVCVGNICRSPAAEGTLRHLVSKRGLESKVEISSCGIGDWHVGQPPDSRIRQSAQDRGITLSSKAKVFMPQYLDEYDYIMASDPEVLEYLLSFTKTPEQKAKIHLMTSFSKAYKDSPIPDPFYGGQAAFDQVLDMLEEACNGLLDQILGK